MVTSAARDPTGGPAHVDMRSGGRSGNRASEGDKWDAHFTQLLYQRFTFRAIGVDGNIHRVVVIETQPIVRLGLSQSRYGQLPAKTLREISFNPRCFLKRPFKAAVKSRRFRAFAEAVYRQYRQTRHFFAENRFRDRDVSFDDGMAHGINLIECGDECLLRFFDFLLRDFSVVKKLAFRDDFRAQSALVLFVFEQKGAVRLEARAHFHNPIGAVCRACGSGER